MPFTELDFGQDVVVNVQPIKPPPAIATNFQFAYNDKQKKKYS